MPVLVGACTRGADISGDMAPKMVQRGAARRSLFQARSHLISAHPGERTLLRTLAFCPTSGFFLCAGTISTSSTCNNN